MANQLKVKDIIIIVSLMTLSTCSEGTSICFVGENRKLKEYDNSKEICCGDVIYKHESDEVKCCGNVTFDDKNEICCQGKVFTSVVNNTKFVCCGSQLYSVNDTLQTKSNTVQACCGNKLYDESKLGCCASETYDQNTHYCFDKQTVLPYGISKCGETIFKNGRSICCSGHLHNKTDNVTSCCGTKPYNTILNICCHSSSDPHIAPSGDHRCCGSSYYNIKNQTCCNRQVMNTNSKTESCCGVKLFDGEFQGCCAGKIYNKSTHKCCDRSVISFNSGCCGNRELDVKTEVCCHNKFPLKKSDPNHNACCRDTKLANTGKSYDKDRYMCREGNPPEITFHPTHKKCGSDVYDELTDLCCNGKKYINSRINDKQCCLPGNQAYHPNEQICCDGIVYNITLRKSCITDINPIVEPFIPIEEEKISTYGICTICDVKWKKEDFRQAIENEKINTCLKSALKVKVVRVSHNKRRRKLHQTSLSLKVRKNLYNPRGFPKKRGKINILLPCTCSSIFTSDMLLLVTNIDLRKNQLRLGDSDVLVPYFPPLRKTVKQRHGQCDRRTKTTYIKSINDIQDYINYQLKKTFS